MDHIKSFHSLPSLYFLAFFSLGITIAWFWGNVLNVIFLILVYTVLFVLLFFLGNKKFFFIVCLSLFLLAGLIRMWLALYPLTNEEINLFEYDYDAFQGTIIETDYRDKKSNIYVLKCEKVFRGDEYVYANGLIVINQGKNKNNFNYGDVIRIQSKADFPTLPSNPGEFNYRRYLQLNDRFFYLRLDKDTQVIKIFRDRGNGLQSYLFNPMRNTIQKIIDSYLSGQSPAVVKALILGQRGDLDQGIISDFQKTGVIHVLAISGLHVGFIALMLQFSLALLRVPQKIAMAFVILFLVFFVALVNFKAPVVRASLMMSFYYLSKFTSRPQKALNIIALAGIVILMVQPEQLLLPGFQYSFAAVFGLIYGSEKLNSLFPYFTFNTKITSFINKYIRTPFIASLSAILATMPLTWYYFSSIQIGAILANVFIIPYIAVILFLCILFVCFSWFPFFPVSGIAVIIDFLIDWMIYVVKQFALLPYIQIITGHPHILLLVLVIAAVVLIFNLKLPKARLAAAVIFTALILISLSRFVASKNLKITFINVGQGDATLLQFPNNKIALIDAGNKGFGFDAGQRYVSPLLKYYGLKKLDYLIASHPHSDHIGGFEFILAHFAVDTLVLNEFRMDSKQYDRILDLARGKNVFLKRVDCGDIINADRHTRLYVLHPTDRFEQSNQKSGEKVNNSSVVIKLVHGRNSILFNGDAEEAAEQAMTKYQTFLDCDLIKVGHHGSKTSSSNNFLDLALPEKAVISVGKKNKFKHPSPETLVKYHARGIFVYRTDIYGAIVFESDGINLERLDWRL